MSAENGILKNPSYQAMRRGIVENIAPLVLVLGSGISVPAGLPDWSTLRKTLQGHMDDAEQVLQSTGSTSSARGLADAARRTNDYWMFFKLARKALTPATYRELIRQALDDHKSASPLGYELLLDLDPKGLVTLNLDRFSAQAMASANPGLPIAPIYGKEIARKWPLITDETPFLVYLHGIIDDANTWVLDSDEYTELTSNPGHALFLSTLYLNNIVLFAGVSVDDMALSAPLLTINEAGLEPRRLYWLTSRGDGGTTSWAEENNVQIIRYAAGNNKDHIEAFTAIVDDIRSFRSVDTKRPLPEVTNVRLFPIHEKIATAPDEIAGQRPEDARKALSTLLNSRLSGKNGDDLYKTFSEFSAEYDYPIQTRAFYRADSDIGRVFFDYKLIFPPMGVGNFGTVYQALDNTGGVVAVKIMHNNILHNEEMLGGFRRGSASMRILTNNNVQGISQIIENFEMPPTIVMQYVSGNSMSEIFDAISEAPWQTKVAILRDIAKIVDSCHKLPDSVLHRDLKPSNVMIEGYDYSTHDYDRIVVLDFDMSWHKGSSEKDVVFESRDDFGYLSPEQTDPSQTVHARSTKVDSYGFGMTAYAIFSGKHPIPNMPLDGRWVDLVNSACRRGYAQSWRSLGYRLGRVVFDATAFDQRNRIDFGSVRSRIDKISEVVHGNDPAPIDVVAEELLAQCSGARRYAWDDVADRGRVDFVNGVSVVVEVDHAKGNLRFRVQYQGTGSQNYNNADRLVAESRAFFQRKHLQRSDKYTAFVLKVVGAHQKAGYLNVEMTVSGMTEIQQIDALSAYIEEGIRPLRNI